MTLVIPPGFAELSILYTLTGDAEAMVSTIGCETPGTGADPAWLEALSDAWLATIGLPGGCSNQWTYRGMVARVGQDGGPPSVIEHPESVVGEAADQCVPNNTSWLIKKTTDRGGRQGRGRMYLAPFGLFEAFVSNTGVIADGLRSNLQSRCNGFLQAEALKVLLHDSESPGSTNPDLITGLVVDLRVATQRRRLRH